ncbi:MAG: DUF3108 domain-containing protein [Bryobacterales bacterium]
MKKLIVTFALLALPAALKPATAETPAPTPFKPGERLRYEVVWPSGLSLGEAEFVANTEQGGWKFGFSLAASLPNFEIKDQYTSETDFNLCSKTFHKQFRHGSKQTDETVTFDQDAHRAQRTTAAGGGESSFDVPPCGRDGLAFLYFLRQDLARGRISPPDDINFGGQYMITVTYAESRPIMVAGAPREADRILVDILGEKAQHSFEIFFSKDEARTPLAVNVPFELGTFSLRLVE